MKTARLLTVLSAATVAAGVACAGSPLDRANDTLTEVEERLAAIHERVVEDEAYIKEAAAGYEDACPPPTAIQDARSMLLGTEFYRRSEPTWTRRTQVIQECGLAQAKVTGTRMGVELLAEGTDSERIRMEMGEVRARLATANPEGLAQILDNAETVDEAWNALLLVNHPMALLGGNVRERTSDMELYEETAAQRRNEFDTARTTVKEKLEEWDSVSAEWEALLAEYGR